MFDSLIDWQNGKITRAGQSPALVHPFQVTKHAVVAVRLHEYTVDKIGAGQLQTFPGDLGGIEAKQRFSFVTQ
jgi:hypothetical protein